MSYVDVIKYAPQPITMLTLLILLVIRMFFYSNVLYYSISLIGFSLILLSLLVKNYVISPITIALLIIVYVGAMIVLIGYICAVCPNINLSYSGSFLLALFCFVLFTLFYSPIPVQNSFNLVSLSDYFYSPLSCSFLYLLALVLFLTLLIVTSQYLTPKGPFRSL